MIRTAALAVALLAAGVAEAQPHRGRGGSMGGGGYADPSEIIADELALHRIAGEKGQWKAFADVAAKDAVLFVPQPVFAQRWLKSRRDLASPLHWQVHRVVMACDGSVGLSTGAWQSGDGRHGRYATLWRRDPKKGDYFWTLRADTPTDRAEEAPEAIDGRVAFCAHRGRRAGPGPMAPPAQASTPAPVLDPGQPLPAQYDGRSDDGTLRWRWLVAPDGARSLEAWMATEEGETPVLSDRTAAPGR